MPPSSLAFSASYDLVRPIFFGMVFAGFLNGVAGVQTLTWFCANRRGSPMQKIAILLLLLLDTAHTGFVAHVVYHYTVNKPLRNATLIPIAVWSIAAQLSLHMLVVPLIQSFYTMRLWNLTPRHRRWIPITSVLLVIVDVVLGLDLSVKLYNAKTFLDILNASLKPFICVVLSLFFITNMVIGSALIHALAFSRLNLGWTNSSTIMVLAYLINTGVMAGMLSIAGIILFTASSNISIYLAVQAVQLKLHINSFMAMMNARHYLQHDVKKSETNDNATDASQGHLESRNTSFSGSCLPEREPAPSSFVLPTINEVGLPFFNTSMPDVQVDGPTPKVVQVMVEHEAISSGI